MSSTPCKHPTTGGCSFPLFNSLVLQTFLTNCCVPGSVQGAGNTEVNETQLFPSRIYCAVGSTGKRLVNILFMGK